MERIGIGLVIGVVIAYVASTCSFVSFPPAVSPGTSRTDFNAYAAAFEYDTEWYGDKQILADSTLQNNGPLAEIQPTEDAFRADSGDMYDGVVLGRIIVHPDTLAFNGYSYPRYAVADTGVVYWFVQHDSTFFVPRDTTLPMVARPLVIGAAHPENWKYSLARWQWAPVDEQAWVTCDKNRCCYGN